MFLSNQVCLKRANGQVLKANKVSRLIDQFQVGKERYDYQVLTSERVQSFVKKFLAQVVSVEKVRENPLNKSYVCQDKGVMNQFKLNSCQKLIGKLYEAIELSKTSQEVEQAAANGITILKNLDLNFVQKNFERIKIRGADLGDAIFQDCNFKNVDFQEVNLVNAKFNDCNYEGANLVNAKTEKIYYCISISGHTSCIFSLAISSDNKFIISGSKNYERQIKIWNFQTGILIRTLEGHSNNFRSVVLTNVSKFIVSGSDDNTIKMWDFQTGNLIRTLTGHSSFVNSKFIISGSADVTIKVWDFQTGQLMRTLTEYSHWVRKVLLTSDNGFIISVSWDSSIRIWNFNSSECVQTLSIHEQPVYALALSVDNKWLLSGGEDKVLRK